MFFSTISTFRQGLRYGLYNLELVCDLVFEAKANYFLSVF
jgi:hypothetical protein